jgi:hypothetical protein
LSRTQPSYYPNNLWLTNSKCNTYEDGSYIDLIHDYNDRWDIWLTYALYWMLQSTALLGYGDITPRNPYEVAYCDVVIVLLTLVYAFFINTVWKIMSELTVDKELKYKKMLKMYQKYYRISDETVVRFIMYVREAIKLKESEEIEQQIMESLSAELREEFLLERQTVCYQKIPLF